MSENLKKKKSPVQGSSFRPLDQIEGSVDLEFYLSELTINILLLRNRDFPVIFRQDRILSGIIYLGT